MTFHTNFNFVVMVVMIKPYKRAMVELAQQIIYCKKRPIIKWKDSFSEPSMAPTKIFMQRISMADIKLKGQLSNWDFLKSKPWRNSTT